MRSWQFGALVALCLAIVVEGIAGLLERPWSPTHLLVLMLIMAPAVGLVDWSLRRRESRDNALGAVVNLLIGGQGVLLFLIAQRWALPLDTVDHRHLDAAVVWCLLVMVADAVSCTWRRWMRS